jgi:hypothetical protein
MAHNIIMGLREIGCGLDSDSLGCCSVAGSCEHGNELTGFIKNRGIY